MSRSTSIRSLSATYAAPVAPKGWHPTAPNPLRLSLPSVGSPPTRSVADSLARNAIFEMEPETEAASAVGVGTGSVVCVRV